MYSIRLNDGTEIKNLELNGNNLIPESAVDKAIFENNLDKVIITNDNGDEEELFNQKVQFAKIREKLRLLFYTARLKRKSYLNCWQI